jgi:hypothetical protein
MVEMTVLNACGVYPGRIDAVEILSMKKDIVKTVKVATGKCDSMR